MDRLLNNKYFKMISMLLILIIFSVVLINTKQVNHLKNNIITYFEANNYEEKDLRDAVNTMYVTMTDKKSNVIATSNPDREINSSYKFSDTKKPSKMPNTTDEYNILFEIMDTSGNKGYTKLEENVIYSMELPEYIVPQNAYDEGINVYHECHSFVKKGKTIACGGIYQEQGKYFFKALFKDVLNKKNVKASYQFNIKLDKTIEDEVFDVKTIDFDLPGILKLYMAKEEIIELGTDYTLKVQNNGWTSSTYNYAKWTVTLTDNKESDINTKGILYLNFENDMGIPINQQNWFKDIKIYADGEELISSKTGQYENSYYKDDYSSDNQIIKIDLTEAEEEEYEKETQSSQYPYMLKSLKLKFSKNDGSKIKGIKEWKIELVGADYHVKNNQNYQDFILNAKFEDSNTTSSIYQNKGILKKEYIMPQINLEITDKKDINKENIPKTIEYTGEINSFTSNVLTIEDNPNYVNNTGFYYYINNRGFSNTEKNLDSSIQVFINNKKEEFIFCDINNQDQLNGVNSPLQNYNNGDIKVHLQMKNSADSYDLGDYRFYKSKNTNVDGDYYWIVISKKTYDLSMGYPSYDTAGREGYSENEININNIYEPSTWKIYLYNASNQDVKIIFNEFIDSTEEYRRSTTEEKTIITNQIIVNDDLKMFKTVRKEVTLELPNVQPMKAIGEWVDANTIKWNVEIDFSTMNISIDALYYYMFYVYTPKNQHMNNSLLYICKDLSCDSSVPTGQFTSEGAYPNNKEMLRNIIGTNNFNRYSTGSTGSKYITDNRMKFTFETKLDNYTNNSNKEGYEDIWIEFVGTKGSNISYRGVDLDDINLYTQTAVYTPVIQKKENDLYVIPEEKKICQNFDIESDLYCNQCFGNNMYFLDDYVGGKYKSKIPLHFYGTYTIFDKYETSNEVEEIIAKNTYIDEVRIEVDGDNDIYVYGKLSTGNTDSNYYNYDITEKIFYKNYQIGNKTYKARIESNNKDNFPNMYDGITINVEGIKRGNFIKVHYTTIVDIENLAKELSFISTEKTNIYELVNKASWNKTATSSNNSSKDTSAKVKLELLADLSINKNVDLNEDSNYKNDSKKQEVISTMGYTSSKYLKITDFVDGISNLKYNSNTKKYDKESLSTDINKLTNIRNYIDISDLNIYIKNHYDDDSKYQSIYSNGSFISEYDESTLEYIDNSNELYKLYLVRSDGNDIPAFTDVKITYNMTFNPNKEESYRLNNDYSGGKYYISTNAEGIRTYESAVNNNPGGISFTKKDSILRKLSSQDGNYENRIDSTNHELIVYASNEGAAIGADYLAPPKIIKTLLGKDSWEITYDINSTGKGEKPKLNITDGINFNVDGNSNYNDDIIPILKKYTKYKNIKIYYNGKNTSIENLSYTIEKLNNNNSISFNDISGTLTCTNTSYNLDLSGFNYGDKVIITYDVDIDYESAIKEMYEKGYIDEKNRLKDTNKIIKFNYNNGVSNPNYEESFTEKSSSYISVGDFAPTITKSNPSNNNDESTWELKFNTGIHSKDIKVTDKIKIDSENEELIQVIENSLIIKDLIIKYDNNIIYENGQFIDTWKDNITININELGLDLLIKDTDNNKFISNNKEFIISYKTSIDEDKYNSKISNGIFSIENSVELEKDSLKSKDALIKSDVNYDFPMTIDKEFIGNNSNLTETNWKYTIESGRLNRDNVNITDSMELGSNFSKYLSISKLKIIENDKVIFDNTSNINNLGNYKITDNNNDTLLFNKNGHYQFKLNIPKLNKNSKIEVEYTLKVDDNEYIINNEILDNELLIKNKLNVTSADNTNLTEEVNGSSKVTSKLKKKFQFEGYDSNGNPRVSWFIDVNLLSEFTSEELVGKEIIIEDVLSDILELDPSSVRINNRIVTANSDSIESTISNDKYKLNTENNTVNIKLLDPMSTPNLEISFTTNCLASITELENYVTLSIDGKKEEIRSNNQISLISPYSFGFIQSREDLIYNIEGKKLLDDKPSNKEFIFRIEEVDEEGNLKENGYYSEVTNSNDGKITFNALTFTEEGLYYYKVKEVPVSDKYIKYDNTEYLLRIKVKESHETFIIDNLTIMNSESKEIVFNNKTIPKEKNNNIIVNPKTKKLFGIIIYIITILIIGTTISRKKTKVH